MPSKNDGFNHSRLTVARQLRGLSKGVLADQIDVTRRSVGGYESGEAVPSERTLRNIVDVLDFPRGFFFGDDLEIPQPDAVSFRAMSKMTAAQRNMALGEGALALQLNEWIESRFELPAASLPDLRGEPTPEAAADALRQIWRLGQQPIPNMIHLLEAKGVRVFSLSVDSREVDAYSMWRESTPYIFLNTFKSAERSRFDAAHELAHLLLHRHAAPQGRVAEQQADDFASSFLLPRASVLAHAPRFATLPALIRLKHFWGVSVAALTYRLHKVGVLSDWHYRTLYTEIGKRGYQVNEPESQPHETSEVLHQVLGHLRSDGISRTEVAVDLQINESDLDRLMFGLVLTSLRGGRTSDDPVQTSSGDRQLRLLE